MQNAASLIRATRGRGIIISSEARKAVGVRAPFDVMNLATLWGLSQEKGREAVGGLSRTVVVISPFLVCILIFSLCSPLT
jgi:ribonuclease P/MRP protein subunit RPP1